MQMGRRVQGFGAPEGRNFVRLSEHREVVTSSQDGVSVGDETPSHHESVR